jgi:primosomal protein N' (replication factor Y)
MQYFEVWVRSNRYHGLNGLSYCYEQKLRPGQLVSVPLRNETFIGVIVKAQARAPEKVTLKKINSVIDLPPLPVKLMELMRWLKEYYPAPVGAITKQFIPAGIDTLNKDIAKLENRDQNPPASAQLPPLSKQQLAALETMLAVNTTYLLHGITGSGKTRLYMELAKQELARGRSVLMLTPEISLTTQLEIGFNSTFPGKTIVIHSTLTPKQRTERWASLNNSSEPRIVIGPRSTIFSPLKDIGLIILDEEHEPAYKQEQSPYYLTSRVAAKLRQLHQAKLILGSATPLISDYYLAKSLDKPIVRMTELANSSKVKPISRQTLIIDSKDRSLFNRSAYLSQPLIDAIDQNLSRKEQTLLYLNRRGTARVIICEKCDWQARCSRCDLPLTYHGDSHNLRCHNCGFMMTAPVTCPQCKNPSIKYLSVGTKAIVDEAGRLFPEASIRRFDTDNLKADRLEQNFQEIHSGNIDIIVGTQMLAKGLDLPKLSLVGVIMADTSLQLPDYTANERTYQLLEQVVGRVGRGHLNGLAIIQTYQPNNPTISAAINDDWNDFYTREVEERQKYAFPPFVHMLKLSIQRASAARAETAALKLKSSLPETLRVEGPAPAFHERLGGKYRWQLIVKSTNRSDLTNIIATLPSGWSYNIDPIDLI